MDADNIHFDVLMKVINDTFGKNCVLFNAHRPGAQFSGVLNVVHPPAQAPAGCLVDLGQARSKLIDAVVECDDALMEKYLLEGTIADDELIAAIPKALAAGTVIPIFCTSAKKDVGIAELLEAICEDALSPVEGAHRKGIKGTGDQAKEAELQPSESGELVGQVFKTLSDKFVGTLAFFRIFSGKMTSDQPLVNVRSGKSSRTGGLLLMQGKNQQSITEAIAGDIIAVAKVEDLHIGDTVAANAQREIAQARVPTPMFGLAVEPKARGDEQRSQSLQRIADEDPTFHMTRDMQTHELVITGMPAASRRDPAPPET